MSDGSIVDVSPSRKEILLRNYNRINNRTSWFKNNIHGPGKMFCKFIVLNAPVSAEKRLLFNMACVIRRYHKKAISNIF